MKTLMARCRANPFIFLAIYFQAWFTFLFWGMKPLFEALPFGIAFFITAYLTVGGAVCFAYLMVYRRFPWEKA